MTFPAWKGAREAGNLTHDRCLSRPTGPPQWAGTGVGQRAGNVSGREHQPEKGSPKWVFGTVGFMWGKKPTTG